MQRPPPKIIESSSSSPAPLRADKWLWAVRLFKTRALAAEACQAGRIKRVGKTLKPSSLLRPGDGVTVGRPGYEQTVRVEDLPARRVGAKVAATCYTDLTPPEAVEAARRHREQARAADPAGGRRAPGQGRPTKLERREIDKLRKGLRDLGYGGES